MCLIVQDMNGQLPNEFVPMKATKDIVVYKMLEYAILKSSLHKKIYRTPYMWSDVNFNLFGRCVMKTGGRMTGEYTTIHSYRNYILHGRFVGTAKQVQKIEWVNGKNLSNVTRSNDIGINDKETLTISEGIHAYTKIPQSKRFSSCLYEHRNWHKAIIPKGSYYFIDEANGEIVADKMIIFKKVVK